MMSPRKALVALLISALLSLAADAATDPPELVMTDVEPDRAERIRTYNGNYFERALVFARRWRVVELDPQALFQNSSVRIRPFPDVDLVVRRSPGPTNRAADRTWLGVVEFPAVSDETRDGRTAVLDALFEQQPDLRHDEKRIRHEFSVQANFTMALWTVDETSGVATHRGSVPWPRLPPIEERDDRLDHEPAGDRQQSADTGEMTGPLRGESFLSLIGSITNPVDQVRYMIEPVPRSPRYHIVYEFDSSAHVRGLPPGPARDLALQRSVEFEASLPPDPPYPPLIVGEIE